MIRVIVADDHAVVRQGLKQIISETPDLSLVGEAASGGEALDLVRGLECDALVLDINMPGPGGLDILRELRALRPKLPILILSMHPEEQFAVRLLRSGADGYLNKESAPDELVNAIRKVATGGKYVSAALAEKLALDLQTGGGPPHEALSDREFQVLRLIGQGKTASEIAALLSLSVKTVSTYRARILQKMDLSTNAELMRYALEHGLAE
jgi:two-component system invasion response regulator UvrY